MFPGRVRLTHNQTHYMKTSTQPGTKRARKSKSQGSKKATSQASKRLELTRPLGLEGWSDLDPIILAALATEEPILLVGKHGTAKSFILERLAKALGQEFRFYNSSLINYDDLVGFPIPNESNSSLEYISTPSSIWDAEVVFLDEINRCRPELQNKLFPIVHERRVQGIQLEKLRYRWAAMNPPPEPDTEEAEEYLGAEPLDPALADRFSFILTAPSWSELNHTSRLKVISDQYAGEHPFTVSPGLLVEKARKAYLALQSSPPVQLAEYVIALENQYSKTKGYLSTRRLTNLHRNILAIHAARTVIEGVPAKRSRNAKNFGDWEESAYLALIHSLPETVNTGKTGNAKLLAMHKQVWEIIQLDDTSAWKEILNTGDPLKRLVVANGLREKLGDLDLGKVILEALSAQTNRGNKATVALASYLAFSQDRDIPATVVETLATELTEILTPEPTTHSLGSGAANFIRQVAGILVEVDQKVNNGEYPATKASYLRNLLYTGSYSIGDTPENRVDLFEKLWKEMDLENVVKPEEHQGQ